VARMGRHAALDLSRRPIGGASLLNIASACEGRTPGGSTPRSLEVRFAFSPGLRTASVAAIEVRRCFQRPSTRHNWKVVLPRGLGTGLSEAPVGASRVDKSLTPPDQSPRRLGGRQLQLWCHATVTPSALAMSHSRASGTVARVAPSREWHRRASGTVARVAPSHRLGQLRSVSAGGVRAALKAGMRPARVPVAMPMSGAARRGVVNERVTRGQTLMLAARWGWS
jgi:hypothetical protein